MFLPIPNNNEQNKNKNPPSIVRSYRLTNIPTVADEFCYIKKLK